MKFESTSKPFCPTFNESKLPGLVRQLISSVQEEEDTLDRLLHAIAQDDHETVKSAAKLLSEMRNDAR